MTHFPPPLNDCRSLAFHSLYFISGEYRKKKRFQDNSNAFLVLRIQNKKANLLKVILRQLGHLSSKDSSLSAPLLTRDLALSGLRLLLKFLRFYFSGKPLKQNSNQMEIFG
jgi:hypothetical protein